MNKNIEEKLDNIMKKFSIKKIKNKNKKNWNQAYLNNQINLKILLFF
jgi:hypothetical protein